MVTNEEQALLDADEDAQSGGVEEYEVFVRLNSARLFDIAQRASEDLRASLLEAFGCDTITRLSSRCDFFWRHGWQDASHAELVLAHDVARWLAENSPMLRKSNRHLADTLAGISPSSECRDEVCVAFGVLGIRARVAIGDCECECGAMR